ncbi:hypothetical protein HYDPIDRAFT_25556 [Hydnomerulius pinastri MD-312]|nr:hypothetical protein HYDPIDRAFT_25556 [Hydnomerulius pinastri MD-312]
MPESMFGRPSQHLLPSQPVGSTGSPASTSSQAAPVHGGAPRFEDFRFNSIGKQPQLLSRISIPDPDHTEYHSPTPSPTSTTSPIINNGDAQPPQSSSRPTLLQQLAGGGGNAMNGSFPHASPNRSSGTLVSRMQLNSSTSNNSGNVTLGASRALPPPRPRPNRAKSIVEEGNSVASNNLIPPIEFLPPAPESAGSSPPPFNLDTQVQGSEIAQKPHSSFHSRTSTSGATDRSPELLYPTSPVSLQLGASGSANTSAAAAADTSASSGTTSSSSFSFLNPDSRMPTSIPSAISLGSSLPSETHMVVPSFSVADAIMRDAPQPSTPSSLPMFDSLASRMARLQGISNNLANLASPLASLSSTSPSPDPLHSQIRDTLNRQGAGQTQQESSLIALHHPYQSQNQPSQNNIGNGDAHQMDTSENDSALIAPSSTQPSALTREFQSHTKNILDAVQHLSSAFGAAHRAHVDSENALAHRIRSLEEQRAAFEEQKRTQEAAVQGQLHELRQQREELRAKEAALLALERENRVREEARKAVSAKRQAQEEEKRVEGEKRRQEVQEQVARALEELEELRASRAEGRFEEGRQGAGPLRGAEQEDLPTEPQEGMSEEEVRALKMRNDLLGAVERLRRIHEQKMLGLEESTTVLRGLREERKQKEAEEAEGRRIAEEERQRVLAEEAERSRQAAEEDKQRQRLASEAEEERRQAETSDWRRQIQLANGAPSRVGVGQAQLLAEQQAHAEAQAQVSRQHQAMAKKVEQELEQRRRQEEFAKKRAEVMAQKQQANAQNAARIRAAREGGLAITPPGGNNAMDVDAEGTPTAADNLPASGTQKSTEVPHPTPAPPKSKKAAKPVSGGVMLSASHASDSGSSQPTKSSSAKKPSISSSSDSAHEPMRNTGPTGKAPSFVSALTEAGRQVQTDAPLFPIQLASELNTASVANHNSHLSPASTPTRKQVFTPNPKSQTLLDTSNAGNQELNIGPQTGVSPAQRNVNLRHLKKSRSRIEENGSGDRSVRRSSVKSEDNMYLSLKKEDCEDEPLPHEPEPSVAPTQQETTPGQREPSRTPIPLPPRPAVIPPPRPKISTKLLSKLASSQPSPRNNTEHELPFTGGEAEGGSSERSQRAPAQVSRTSPNPWVMDASAEHQEWAPVLTPPTPVDASNSLLLGPQEDSRYAGRHDQEESMADRDGSFSGPSHTIRLASPEPPSASRSYESEGEARPPNRPGMSDENRKRRRSIKAHRQPQIDHYSPPSAPSRTLVPSPPPSYRPSGDFYRPQSASDLPRAQPMRLPSPTAGRKRPSDSIDDEHDHRSRRPRGDVWQPHDHNRDRDSLHASREWRPYASGSLHDERRASWSRRSPSPDRNRPHVLDIHQRKVFDRQDPATPPLPEASPPASAHPGSSNSAAHWEQMYRRAQNEVDRYQQYQPPPSSSASRMQTGEQYRANENSHFEWPADSYERSPVEERGDVQHDPTLLARMSDKQRYPV